MLTFPNLVHRQIAYVTNDLDEALRRAGETYGIKKHFIMNTQENPQHENQPALKIALANITGAEFEFIQPLGFNDAVYSDPLPKNGEFTIKFHHIAFRIMGTLEDYEEFRHGFDVIEHPVVVDGHYADDARWFYTDERKTLGHYMEYVWYSPKLAAMMKDAIPDQETRRPGGRPSAPRA